MANLLALHPYTRAVLDYLIKSVRADGVGVHITSAYRSSSEQQFLWRMRFLRDLPVAPPGCSLHEYGFAFDIISDDYRAARLLGLTGAKLPPGQKVIVERARALGLFWFPSDPPHFQIFSATEWRAATGC